MTATLRRIIKAGFKSFFRNSFVSFATVLIMTVTLMIIGMLIFLNAVLTSAIDEVRNKVDVNVYFITSAPEQEILDLKGQLEALPEVAFVEYTDREASLAEFRERNKDDQLTLQALEELGENPLGASLSIKAAQPSQYESIANFLSEEPVLGDDGNTIIDEVNYFQNRIVIERLNAITDAIERTGFILALVFAVASVVISFNTIRLAIYTAREEIQVMRLVGASNAFARGPFIVEGALYGIVSAVLTAALFYPLTLYVGSYTAAWFGGLNLFNYYAAHFFWIFLVLLGVGVLLGVISSFLAVQKHLKV